MTPFLISLVKGGTQGWAGEGGGFFFAAKATNEGVGLLHEEQGGARLPGIGACRTEAYAPSGIDLEATCLREIEGMNPAAGEEVANEEFVDGEEATAEEPALVVAAAGPCGQKYRTKLVPGQPVREFVKDGAEDCAVDRAHARRRIVER